MTDACGLGWANKIVEEEPPLVGFAAYEGLAGHSLVKTSAKGWISRFTNGSSWLVSGKWDHRDE